MVQWTDHWRHFIVQKYDSHFKWNWEGRVLRGAPIKCYANIIHFRFCVCSVRRDAISSPFSLTHATMKQNKNQQPHKSCRSFRAFTFLWLLFYFYLQLCFFFSPCYLNELVGMIHYIFNNQSRFSKRERFKSCKCGNEQQRNNKTEEREEKNEWNNLEERRKKHNPIPTFLLQFNLEKNQT